MIHDNVEVYVDDILSKSTTKNDQISYLRKIFHRMREYKLKLKPHKCAFAVSSGKLLGFIFSRRGIEVDPKKVSSIVDFPPKKLKELRYIQGNVQEIKRFIAQLAYMNSPFSYLLKKGDKFICDEKYQKALENIKLQCKKEFVTLCFNNIKCIRGNASSKG